jgi:hypothetical protein
MEGPDQKDATPTTFRPKVPRLQDCAGEEIGTLFDDNSKEVGLQPDV